MIPYLLVVHVGGPGRECDAAIVLRAGDVSRVRIIRPSTLGAQVGTFDEEGDVRHWSDPRWVPTPSPEPYRGQPDVHVIDWRLLDSWHYADECEDVTYPPGPPR